MLAAGPSGHMMDTWARGGATSLVAPAGLLGRTVSVTQGPPRGGTRCGGRDGGGHQGALLASSRGALGRTWPDPSSFCLIHLLGAAGGRWPRGSVGGTEGPRGLGAGASENCLWGCWAAGRPGAASHPSCPLPLCPRCPSRQPGTLSAVDAAVRGAGRDWGGIWGCVWASLAPSKAQRVSWGPTRPVDLTAGAPACGA